MTGWTIGIIALVVFTLFVALLALGRAIGCWQECRAFHLLFRSTNRTLNTILQNQCTHSQVLALHKQKLESHLSPDAEKVREWCQAIIKESLREKLN